MVLMIERLVSVGAAYLLTKIHNVHPHALVIVGYSQNVIMYFIK